MSVDCLKRSLVQQVMEITVARLEIEAGLNGEVIFQIDVNSSPDGETLLFLK